jgi:predicted dehydrogenase
MSDKLRVVVIGAGYWGSNLGRNFPTSPDWALAGICDLDAARADKLANALAVPAFTDLGMVLDDRAVDAVAIATLARTHHPIALAALRAGKHVVVEMPIADTLEKAKEMVEEARRRGLVLMTDHTFCYTPAVLKIRELIEAGELGDILFVNSVRINLGLIQPDVDVFWDLAPHDLRSSISCFPAGSGRTAWPHRVRSP